MQKLLKKRDSSWGRKISLLKNYFLSHTGHRNEQFGTVSWKYLHFWRFAAIYVFYKNLTWNENFFSDLYQYVKIKRAIRYCVTLSFSYCFVAPAITSVPSVTTPASTFGVMTTVCKHVSSSKILFLAFICTSPSSTRHASINVCVCVTATCVFRNQLPF